MAGEVQQAGRAKPRGNREYGLIEVADSAIVQSLALGRICNSPTFKLTLNFELGTWN
jgi:hypothetical protein